MTDREAHLADEMLRLIGAELERRDDQLACHDEWQLTWLARDLRAGLTRAEREADEHAADAFARRASARITAARAERRLPRRELRYRGAPIVATVAQSLPAAAEEQCATMLDLSVAAGAGRELWDEPCESWIELPEGIGEGRFLAMRVSGDSMRPILESGDVVLLNLDAVPVVDDIVVARIPDDGFVVKRVSAIRSRHLELSSFNPAYDPLVVPRDRASILGTVVARFSPKS